MRNSIILVALVCSIVLACKKGKKNAEEPALPPAKAVLVSPAKDEACLSGTDVSATQTSVVLTWNAAANAESYDVVIKNLLTGTSATHPSTQSSLTVNLLKNTPYSWSVTSKSTKTTVTAQSEVWKFYNSGSGESSFAPFPAEAVSPTYAQAVNAVNNKITLDWTGSDVDNDITGYVVYFGTTNTPAVLNANVTASELADITVTANTTYYWKIVTKDSSGNTSDSGIFQFKVN